MGHHKIDIPEKLEYRFDFPAKLKKILFTIAGIGILFIILGLIIPSGGGHHEAAEASEHAHEVTFATRFFGNWLVNAFMFTAVAVIGLFFIAVQIISNGYWYVLVRRIFEAMGRYVFVGVITMLITMAGIGVLYHWAHPEVVEHDLILSAKKAYLNVPFFVIRDRF